MLSEFTPVTSDEMTKIVMQSPSKQCELDALPTWLLKDCFGELNGTVTDIVNLSLATGEFPESLKSATVKPLIKKSSLDQETLKNFRPVSNIPVISKYIEKVVVAQLVSHLDRNGFQEKYQSANKKYHSTETALRCVHNNILRALDSGQCVLLILLDLSAAFDTVDHAILLSRLTNMGVTGRALSWFRSYLTGRTQTVQIHGFKSKAHNLSCGVPQGSVMGPILFLAYLTPLGNIMHQSGHSFMLYADDNQIYIVFRREALTETKISSEQCVADVKSWLVDNKLKFNDDKTEVLLIQSKYRKPVSLESIQVGNAQIVPTERARNIGVIFDSLFSFDHHIINMAKNINYHLYNIGKLRKYLTNEAAKTYVHSIITSRLDFCNSLLYGLPQSSLQPLERALKNAARIVSLTRRSDHITPVMRSLHWLPLKERIEYKIILLTHQTLKGLTPAYLNDLLVAKPVHRASLRSNNLSLLDIPRSSTPTYGDRAFCVAAPTLWNNLPQSIRSIDSLELFKQKLKTLPFCKAPQAN